MYMYQCYDTSLMPTYVVNTYAMCLKMSENKFLETWVTGLAGYR